MYDELTKVDIDKMKAELDHRRLELRPKLIEDVQTARAFGDLSENYEYKVAKQEKNRNESRIRYLERMIATAKVIEVEEREGAVSLFDHVVLYNEKLGKEQTMVSLWSCAVCSGSITGIQCAGHFTGWETGVCICYIHLPVIHVYSGKYSAGVHIANFDG